MVRDLVVDIQLQAGEDQLDQVEEQLGKSGSTGFTLVCREDRIHLISTHVNMGPDDALQIAWLSLVGAFFGGPAFFVDKILIEYEERAEPPMLGDTL